MKYMMLIYGSEAGMAAASDADKQSMLAAYASYTQALRQSGVLLGSRPAGADFFGDDGSFQRWQGAGAERPLRRNQRTILAGYYMIETPDLDAALAWAGRCPGAQFGAVEVRPLWAM
ncbi:MAG: YciI family protein [Alphaproteobacteria bacterium]